MQKSHENKLLIAQNNQLNMVTHWDNHIVQSQESSECESIPIIIFPWVSSSSKFVIISSGYAETLL